MEDQWVVNKPSRSDEVLDADQQLQIADQIRAHFNSIAPKRPIKPNRSESDSPQISSFDNDIHNNIPELQKFRSLISQSHPFCSEEGAFAIQDEFVETQYYKELVSIDRQHHTTGSGFIRVVEGSGDGFGLQLQSEAHGRGGVRQRGFKSNPATNDWVPSMDEYQEEAVYISSKPSRSESCLDG